MQTVQWFNRITVGDEYSNIIRFEEIKYDKAGKIRKNKDGKEQRYKTEWLSSVKIHKTNCFSIPELGRMRADHEDLHNSLKCRGFAAKHEYAYANPNAWLIWKLLMFVAFWIFELFSFTRLAIEAKKNSPWRDFAQELFADLTKISWEILKLSPSLQKERMQFRFDFHR